MSRQSQVNSFNDGLNKDLNPLLTPSTVMTDCLNGTIVTYNGNEFALQNDFGNYKFKNGSLKQGFVPVGIKEYSNILYIVSYNPISDEVEIGSFPSMKTVFTNSNTKGDGVFGITLPNKRLISHSELSSKNSLKLLSDITKDEKISPGDKYILELDGVGEDDKLWKYTAFYILTDNNKLYDITSMIDNTFLKYNPDSNTVYNDEDFKNISWDVPGFLAAKEIVNSMNEFNCYITDFGDTNIDIKVQTIWDNYKYGDIINDLKEKLCFAYCYFDKNKNKDYNWIDILNKNGEWTIIDGMNDSIKYNDLYTSIHTSIQKEKYSDIPEFIKVIPLLRISPLNGESRYIVYDQFETIISTNNILFDKNSISVGNTYFKYMSSNEDFTLNIDVKGSPGISSAIMFEDSKGNYSDITELSEVNYSGQNIWNIKFTQSKDDEYKMFNKENVYTMHMFVYPDGFGIDNFIEDYKSGIENDFVWTGKTTIYTSEILNDYYEDNDIMASFKDKYSFDSIITDDKFAEIAINKKILINDFKCNLQNIVYKIGDVEYQNEDAFLNDVYNKINSWGLKDWVDIKPDQRLETKYGNRYNINFNNLIEFPKNQYGEIGEIWSGAKVKDFSMDINNGAYLGYNNGYYIDIYNSSDVYIRYNSEYFSLPDKENNMYDGSFVEMVKEGDHAGWLKLNKAIFVVKSTHSSDDDTDYVSVGEIYPVYDTYFKVKNSKEIIINVTGYDSEIWPYEDEFVLKHDGNQWQGPEGWNSIWPFEFHFKNNQEKFDYGAQTAEYISNIVKFKNNPYPKLVIFQNRIDSPTTGVFYKIKGTENEDGFAFPKIYLEKSGSSNIDENRFFISIAAFSTDEDKYFVSLKPDTFYYDNDGTSSGARSAWTYAMNTIATYLLMVSGIKYTYDVKSKEYYNVLEFKYDHKEKNKFVLKDADYNFKIYWDNPQYKIQEKMQELSFTYSKSYNIELDNNIKNISGSIEDKANKVYDSIVKFDIQTVRSESHYINYDYWDNPGALNNLLGFFGNKKFTLKDKSNNMLEMRITRKSNFKPICYIYDKWYEI